jgi:putative flippase GtrA
VPRALSSTVAQSLRFLLIGVGGYVVNVVAFTTLYALDSPYLAASLVAYALANALMYLGNRSFTFRFCASGFWFAYAGYVAVGGAVAALNAGLLAALVEGAEADARLSQALSLAAITPLAFLRNKRWTFRLSSA